jgi:hypothetical protein
MSYYIARNGQQEGPVEEAVIRRMVAEGRASPNDLVWMRGMAAWTPISQIFLASPPAIAVPPPASALAVAPAAMAAAAPLAGQGPVPPSMHWFVVLLLGGCTFGIFSIVWAFVIAGFVRKISPKCNGRGLLLATLLFNGVYVCIFALLVLLNKTDRWDRSALPPPDVVASVLGFFFVMIIAGTAISAFFRMRRGLLDYYNSAEPIQLKLSGAMTFFFNIYYLQYHLRRIARWKKTGQLPA